MVAANVVTHMRTILPACQSPLWVCPESMHKARASVTYWYCGCTPRVYQSIRVQTIGTPCTMFCYVTTCIIDNNSKVLVPSGDDMGKTKPKQQMESSSQFIHSFRQGLPSASVHAHVPCMNTSCVSINCSKQSHKFHRDALQLQKANVDLVEQVLFNVRHIGHFELPSQC